MKSYLAAVHYIQIAQGFGDPRVGDMSHLEHVVKGLKKSGPSKNSQARLSITPVILRGLKEVWQKGEINMMHSCRGQSHVCFFAFLQTGEAVAPSDTNFNPILSI